MAEGSEGAVGRDQQRENVEAVGGVVADELGPGPDDLDHITKNVIFSPEPTLNKRLPGGTERCVESKKPRVSSCRNDAASRIFDVNNTITCDS